MKTNNQLIAIAKSQIGNTGGKYRSYAGYGGSWCNMFVYWLFNANGCGTLFPMKTQYQKTYCPTSIEWCKKNLAQIPLYLAMPCDIIYFDWDHNGNPNHIGVVESKVNTDKINTIEGNTDGGKVARKTRPSKYVQAIYRPHFSHKFNDKKLAEDGDCQYQTIGGLQKTLKILGYYNGSIDCILGKGTVRAVQKLVGCSQDGAWGATTSGRFQQYLKSKGYYAGKVDKAFGKQSVLAMQKWINNNAYQQKPASKPTTTTKSATTSGNAQKIVDEIKKLAWANGTAKKKYAYKTGAPKTACKEAMKRHGYKKKAEWSDCGDYVNTVVRETGIDKSFVVQRSVKASFPSAGSHFSIVHKGKAIPDGVLKAGDIIRYKKKKGQHAMFYLGNGLISDAGHYNRFANIRKNDHRYNKSNVRKSTIQVLRVK